METLSKLYENSLFENKTEEKPLKYTDGTHNYFIALEKGAYFVLKNSSGKLIGSGHDPRDIIAKFKLTELPDSDVEMVKVVYDNDDKIISVNNHKV